MWNPTCQLCGAVLPAQAERCPACDARVPASQALVDVMLSLAPESAQEESLLSVGEDEVTLSDALLVEGTQGAQAVSAPNALLLPMAASGEGGEPLFANEQDKRFTGDTTVNQARSRAARWVSPRLLWVIALALLVLFGVVILFARSVSPEGIIQPDWGLASLRIGLVAVILSGPALVVCYLLWRAQVRLALRRVGILALLVFLLGGVGLLSADPLHRLQGQWFEARGLDGLALGAYQLSGASLETDQNMPRIEIEWAEQLSTEHDYGEAVTQLQPVIRLASLDAALVKRARTDLVQAYLAWGDQARQQQAFRAALTHYQALAQVPSCDNACQSRVHAATAQALLGLAQQLTAGQQYDQAIATYQMLVAEYNDTAEGQEAEIALTTPQSLVGRLIYHDRTPAANFLIVLASQWMFDSTAQIFKLEGQQYQSRTDATGAFVVSSVPVGMTYMIAWVDTNGNGGTCSTVNNQPLYTVRMQPLRATDAGAINIECA